MRRPSGTLNVNVNGNVTLNGNPVTVSGTINAAGVISPTEASPAGRTATSSSYSAPLITITGASADFLLTPTLVSQLTADGCRRDHTSLHVS